MIVEKYSASGNDFVIFQDDQKKDRTDLAIKLCDRHEGVGADGLIVLVPHDECDFEWEFYNADGSYASMCGNGSRAAAHFAYKHNLAKSSMAFMTGAGVIHAVVEDDIVETELTKPIFMKDKFEQFGFTWWLLDTGVPHLVTFVDDLASFDLDIASKMRYEHNANVNFAKIEDGYLNVRTYERGVENETLACGTGMAACFLEAHLIGKITNSASVFPKSNEELNLRYEDEKLYFKGLVKKTFTATVESAIIK